jgi:ketosteroid isomerase-like protein
MDVMAWVAAYERAWREQDADGLDALFTPDALYLRSAYDEGLRGLDAIRGFWRDDTPFTMTASPVMVDGDQALVRVEVHYGGEPPHEFRDLWVLRFAADGRVEHFEEWAHWPGMSWSAEDSPATG